MIWDALGEVHHLPTGVGFVDDVASLSVTNGNAEGDRTVTVSASECVEPR